MLIKIIASLLIMAFMSFQVMTQLNIEKKIVSLNDRIKRVEEDARVRQDLNQQRSQLFRDFQSFLAARR